MREKALGSAFRWAGCTQGVLLERPRTRDPVGSASPGHAHQVRFQTKPKGQCKRPGASHANPLGAQRLLANAVPTVPESRMQPPAVASTGRGPHVDAHRRPARSLFSGTFVNRPKWPFRAMGSLQTLVITATAPSEARNATVRRFACENVHVSQNGPGAGFELESPQSDRYFGSNSQFVGQTCRLHATYVTIAYHN